MSVEAAQRKLNEVRVAHPNPRNLRDWINSGVQQLSTHKIVPTIILINLRLVLITSLFGILGELCTEGQQSAEG